MDRRSRAALADLAARIMTESGLDWTSARTKAAKRLGMAPGQASQVDAAEIQAALRAHQALYLPASTEQLRQLREAAAHAMRLLEDFDPQLIGAVAEGIITEHSPIELTVQVDSEKDLEHRLLNAGVGYAVQSRQGTKSVQYRCADREPMVFITANIRGGAGAATGNSRSAPRISLRELEALLASESGHQADAE